MFRLKARPARARGQGVAALAAWLTTCKVDPAESCRGTTAVQALFGLLITAHGNTSVSFDGANLQVGADTIITPANVREYIWGESTEIVTVSDEEVITALSSNEDLEPMRETVTDVFDAQAEAVLTEQEEDNEED